MPEYRVPYQDIPWGVIIGTLVVKCYFDLMRRPFLWIMGKKYSLHRKVVTNVIGWPIVALVILAAFELLMRLVLAGQEMSPLQAIVHGLKLLGK